MKFPMYQIDAFTLEVFKGNPAAVCVLPHWIEEITMQQIAAENNLAETAFIVKEGDDYRIRWFMPHAEIDLCGHATLASAFVIFNYMEENLKEITFLSRSGNLKAIRNQNNAITLDFPSRPPKLIAIPDEIYEALKFKPVSAHASRDLILVYNSEEEILKEDPALALLKDLPYLCIVITARGTTVDFVSRVFDANATSIQEDPVTGSAHSSLVPFWASQLKKNKFKAKQLSQRTGDLYCQLSNDRVYITGFAVPFLTGEINLPNTI
ncbi:PhzF family phenazine biosynthesis protein [Aquimarina intermedia]|nr:PhzF family phenazine biosynthesis protein [Aquimarina intermedia]